MFDENEIQTVAYKDLFQFSTVDTEFGGKMGVGGGGNWWGQTYF